MPTSEHVTQLTQSGYAIIPNVVPTDTVVELIAALAQAPAGEATRRRGVPGVRNLLAVPEVKQLACSPAVRALITPVLGPGGFAVRGILFDKTPGANWNVVWHQDRSVAVRERRDVPGFGPWSQKAGAVHVQPPPSVLARMLTVRLHLDDCDERNGPLRVLPGSHASGRLDADAIALWRERTPESVCPVPAGGVLLMRPLLLHASSDAQAPAHRRVLHLEFAAGDLPGGLEWHERVA